MRKYSFVFALVLALIAANVAVSQTNTIGSTTLSSAVSATDTKVVVASATSISVSPPTQLFVDAEAMTVTGVSGTTISVSRSTPAGHASGATVYRGRPDWFRGYDPPQGTCVLASLQAHPWINTANGRIWTCTASAWTLSNAVGQLVVYGTDITTSSHVGTANTGVTAAEYGTSRDHVTKLTFTNLAMGAPTTAANLAFGHLLYTLPAGAEVISVAYESVGLAGSGSTCDADTPDVGLGTVVASGAYALLSQTSTWENILTGQTASDVNGTATVKTVADQVLVRETGDAKTIYLNAADGWAGACTVTATGTVTVRWSFIN